MGISRLKSRKRCKNDTVFRAACQLRAVIHPKLPKLSGVGAGGFDPRTYQISIHTRLTRALAPPVPVCYPWGGE